MKPISHSTLRWSATLAIGVASFGVAGPSALGQTTQPATAPAAGVKSSLKDFAWLTGRWVGELAKSHSEEIWSAADSGVMMGMFRLVSNEGRTNVIEILTLREVGETVELRFRHLNPDMVCWEAADQPVVLRLEKLTPAEVVFADPTPDVPKKGVPRRQVWRPSGDTLEFEVYALRDGVETRILAGKTTRKPLAEPRDAEPRQTEPRHTEPRP